MAEKTRITDIQELVALMDDAKNLEVGIDVSNIFSNSGKEIYWKCENGHTFKGRVNLI